MQTETEGQAGSLSDADKADPAVAAYLDAVAKVRQLKKDLADAQADADRLAAAMEVQTGDARGRLERIAAHLDVKEQSLRNQRNRGKPRSVAA